MTSETVLTIVIQDDAATASLRRTVEMYRTARDERRWGMTATNARNHAESRACFYREVIPVLHYPASTRDGEIIGYGIAGGRNAVDQRSSAAHGHICGHDPLLGQVQSTRPGRAARYDNRTCMVHDGAGSRGPGETNTKRWQTFKETTPQNRKLTTSARGCKISSVDKQKASASTLAYHFRVDPQRLKEYAVSNNDSTKNQDSVNPQQTKLTEFEYRFLLEIASDPLPDSFVKRLEPQSAEAFDKMARLGLITGVRAIGFNKAFTITNAGDKAWRDYEQAYDDEQAKDSVRTIKLSKPALNLLQKMVDGWTLMPRRHSENCVCVAPGSATHSNHKWTVIEELEQANLIKYVNSFPGKRHYELTDAGRAALRSTTGGGDVE